MRKAAGLEPKFENEKAANLSSHWLLGRPSGDDAWMIPSNQSNHGSDNDDSQCAKSMEQDVIEVIEIPDTCAMKSAAEKLQRGMRAGGEAMDDINSVRRDHVNVNVDEVMKDSLENEDQRAAGFSDGIARRRTVRKGTTWRLWLLVSAASVSFLKLS